MLAKHWLESGVSSVKGFYTAQRHGKQVHVINKNPLIQGIGARQVAEFLSKHWLESGATIVKGFYNCRKDTLGRRVHQDTSKGIGSRQVAKFLSKHWLESEATGVKGFYTYVKAE